MTTASVAVSRASFLRGRFRTDDAPLRPPWAGEAGAFAAACDGCARCVPACPEGIVLIGRDGLAEIDFGRGACTFCAACVASCPTGALGDRGQGPWRAMARVDGRCIALGGVVCRVCEEPCEADAIRFQRRIGASMPPRIDHRACTGCGACVGACPAGAIQVMENRA